MFAIYQLIGYTRSTNRAMVGITFFTVITKLVTV